MAGRRGCASTVVDSSSRKSANGSIPDASGIGQNSFCPSGELFDQALPMLRVMAATSVEKVDCLGLDPEEDHDAQ
jgi:hypothetical protein